jgi:hypothetical protein
MEVVGDRPNFGPSMTPKVNFINLRKQKPLGTIHISTVTSNLPLQVALCFSQFDDHDIKCLYKSWQASQAQMLRY